MALCQTKANLVLFFFQHRINSIVLENSRSVLADLNAESEKNIDHPGALRLFLF